MSSAARADTWSSLDRELYEASAVLDVALGPKTILGCHDAVLAAGERHEIFIVERVDRIGYERARDGFVVDFLRRTPAALDTIRQMSRRIDPDRRYPAGFLLGVDDPDDEIVVATRLGYLDRDGALHETLVRDMSEVARDAGVPAGHPGWPVHVTAVASWRDNRVELGIDSGTDIWYPWTFPYGTAERDYRDNRTLSRLNGSRFNRFLRDVRQACLAAGARWRVVDHGDNDPDGFIILDQPRP